MCTGSVLPLVSRNRGPRVGAKGRVETETRWTHQACARRNTARTRFSLLQNRNLHKKWNGKIIFNTKVEGWECQGQNDKCPRLFTRRNDDVDECAYFVRLAKWSCDEYRCESLCEGFVNGRGDLTKAGRRVWDFALSDSSLLSFKLLELSSSLLTVNGETDERRVDWLRWYRFSDKFFEQSQLQATVVSVARVGCERNQCSLFISTDANLIVRARDEIEGKERTV